VNRSGSVASGMSDGNWERRSPTDEENQPVEVEYDGDQGYAALPVTLCSVCHQDLCCFCDQASYECGLAVCFNCVVTVSDATPSGSGFAKPALSRPLGAAPRAGNSRA
jgi:hypothetical protein